MSKLTRKSTHDIVEVKLVSSLSYFILIVLYVNNGYKERQTGNSIFHSNYCGYFILEE